MLLQNNEQGILYYYPENLSRIGSSLPRWCVLDLNSGGCTDLGLPDYGVVWSAIDRFIATSYSEGSLMIDVNTLKRVEVPYYVLDAAAVPNSPDSLMISLGINASGFRILDLNTFDSVPYDVDGGSYEGERPTMEVAFSPNGELLLLKQNQLYLIVEFATGQVIDQLESIYQAQWLEDSESIVGLRETTTGRYPIDVIRYDLSTRQMTSLASFNEAISIQVVN